MKFHSTLILIVFSLLFALNSEAQKIKYKDLFPILNAKNYAQGEPQLRAFLKNPKNADHPNANLQFAYLLKLAADKLHVVRDSTALVKTADSAAIAYNRSKALVTDKEIKKNDDYYQEYYRRDLRTGEFGIKVSDIHLDLDNNIERYRLVSRKTRELAVALPKLKTTYKESNELFREIATQFETINELALSSNEQIMQQLDQLISNGQKTDDLIDDIQDIVATHPKAEFNANYERLPIANYVTDGRDIADVYEGNFQIWDYKSFAEGVKQKIAEDITDFKAALIEADKSLLNKLAVVERAETLMQAPEIPEELENQIESLDPEGLPGNILRFRKLEIAFKNLELIDEDSAFVTKQLDKVDTLYQLINQMDIIFSKIKARNTEK